MISSVVSDRTARFATLTLSILNDVLPSQQPLGKYHGESPLDTSGLHLTCMRTILNASFNSNSTHKPHCRKKVHKFFSKKNVQAEKRIQEETTLLPQGQKSESRAARSTAGLLLLRAASLVAPGTEAANATAQDLTEILAEGEDDSSADEGDAAMDAEVSPHAYHRLFLKYLKRSRVCCCYVQYNSFPAMRGPNSVPRPPFS
jgi:hypothetical protein